MADGAYIPIVEPATTKELQKISDDFKLGISNDQIGDYLDWVNNTLRGFERLKDLKEETIPVLYPRIPGVKPKQNENPYNAWVTMMVLKGEDKGLLAGKTVAIKDSIFIAGTPLENGSKIWEGYTPEIDATVVTRILQAGATILGKATCENQCFSGQSFTSASGAVRNPHDTTRSAGGSSSGSAVLVATMQVDAALGGDQGGSVRIPAAMCGIVGLKATFGLIPCTGSIGYEATLDSLGPMAANVTDCASLLEVIAGYDEGRDHRQRSDMVIPKYSKMLIGDLEGKRFGLVQQGFSVATEAVQRCIMTAVEAMRKAGAIVEEIDIPEHDLGQVMFIAMLQGLKHTVFEHHGQAVGHNELYTRSASRHLRQALTTQSHDIQPMMKASALIGEYTYRKNGYQLISRVMNQRPTLKRIYDKALSHYDALIMPTLPFVAPKLPPKNLTAAEFIKATRGCTQNTASFNLTGHPALSLKVGMAAPKDDKNVLLPVGLQIVCHHFDEVKLLDLGYGIEKILQL